MTAFPKAPPSPTTSPTSPASPRRSTTAPAATRPPHPLRSLHPTPQRPAPIASPTRHSTGHICTHRPTPTRAPIPGDLRRYHRHIMTDPPSDPMRRPPTLQTPDPSPSTDVVPQPPPSGHCCYDPMRLLVTPGSPPQQWTACRLGS